MVQTGVTTTDVRVIVKGLKSDVEKVVRKLTLDVVANLVAAPTEGGTPVKTGWARANWIVNIGGPTDDVVGSPTNVSGADAAQQAGIGSVVAYKLRSGPVYITNNVPYILRLNDGWSPQAQPGFVQRAIQKAVQELRSVA